MISCSSPPLFDASRARGAGRLEGTHLGNYRVGRRIGAGAMGSVYRLEHTRLPHTFAALKVLTPRHGDAESLRERFVQEAMLAATIGGDRVARPLDIGELDDGTPYIVMEYIAGRTIAELLEDGPLAVATALAIACRIADTMALAHARGIIHRNLKPSNLMLVEERGIDVRVLDFGVARAQDEMKLAQTLECTVVGTPGYMSPEAASGMSVDDRTDVFSLGVTLFQMFTGALPFVGDNAQARLAALLTQAPPALSARRPPSLEAVPQSIDALVAEMLHRRPEARPSMMALRERLAEATTARPHAKPPARARSVESCGPGSRSAGTRTHKPVMLLLLLCLAIAIVGALSIATNG